MRQTVSLNDITNIAHPNVFTHMPPISYGSFLNDNKYKTKKFRRYMMARFYKNVLNRQNIVKTSPKGSPKRTLTKGPNRSVSFCGSGGHGVFFHG